MSHSKVHRENQWFNITGQQSCWFTAAVTGSFKHSESVLFFFSEENILFGFIWVLFTAHGRPRGSVDHQYLTAKNSGFLCAFQSRWPVPQPWMDGELWPGQLCVCVYLLNIFDLEKNSRDIWQEILTSDLFLSAWDDGEVDEGAASDFC